MADRLELQAKLKLLSHTYAVQLPEKLRQLEQTWDILSQDAWDDEGYRKLHRMVHSLSGSGKTFGFAALSEAAHALEAYLKPIGAAKMPFTAGQREQLDSLLAVLKQAGSEQSVTHGSESMAVAASLEHASLARRVFVVEDDVEQAAELKIQLSYFGYDVVVFHTTDDFKRFMQNDTTGGVVLMDINFPGDTQGGIHIMNELQQGRAAPLSVIFLSAETGLDFRLAAVRAGGVAYINKPVNIGTLIDKMDELTSTHVATAYRVLIVDDSVNLTEYYTAVLEQAGMSVRVVNDPLMALKPLFEFAPDLILIDMYMPGCNGMELAKIIRQINDFISIPIVFLSAEVNQDKQLLAIGMGGDDFLTKPIQPQHLVSSVASRIKRSLVLRSFMVRDSLTGLLNHTAIKDQLFREMGRAKRQGKPLVFAMIDIDHFKLVNDGYGHPAGDRVIKSLSRLLKQRLREHDLVGRYGGEEFAVILVDADGPSAIKILDNIRNDFAQLRHLAGNQEFSVTFSAGIADIAHYAEASRLTDAADKALYKAKHAGRNQVVLADGKPH